MATIDIEQMYWEMEQTMENNFIGTPKQRYMNAKKQFLDSVAETIEANKKDLIAGCNGD